MERFEMVQILPEGTQAPSAPTLQESLERFYISVEKGVPPQMLREFASLTGQEVDESRLQKAISKGDAYMKEIYRLMKA